MAVGPRLSTAQWGGRKLEPKGVCPGDYGGWMTSKLLVSCDATKWCKTSGHPRPTVVQALAPR
ncbi:MAG: hypothetical protein QGI09_12445, partial [Dehalococcoidia bacterium]|nr:hypothetical protein [Dehalococcoidia bacterium]